MSECQQDLKDAGKPYPRTCPLCGLGPCSKYTRVPVAGAGREGVASPMGFFYRVNIGSDERHNVYRCTLGQAWERMDVYDIGGLSPAELRFLADVIDASKRTAA